MSYLCAERVLYNLTEKRVYNEMKEENNILWKEYLKELEKLEMPIKIFK